MFFFRLVGGIVIRPHRSTTIVSHRALQNRLNRSRCRLGCGLAWGEGTMYVGDGVQMPLWKGIILRVARGVLLYKSSAVAEMGDRLAAVDMGGKVGGLLCPFFGDMGPHLTTSPGPRPTSVPSVIDPFNRLATIYQRYRQDRTDRQRSDSIGRTVLQTVAKKYGDWGVPSMCGSDAVFLSNYFDSLVGNQRFGRCFCGERRRVDADR